MLTGLAVYFGGMALTGLLVWFIPSPPPRWHEWVLALSLWPLTLMALMVIGTRR